MTLDQLIESLPLLTGIFLAVAVLFIVLSSNFFRKSRRAPYWTQRRTAGQRGFRMLLVALFFMTISAIFCGMALTYGYIDPDTDRDDRPTEQAFSTQLPENTLVDTNTPAPATDTPEATQDTVFQATTEAPTIEVSPDATTPTLDILQATTEAPTSEVSPDVTTPPALVEATTEVPTATDTPTDTATDAPTFTPSDTPTATDTPTPSDTPTPTPSDTPMPSPTPALVTGDYPTLFPYKSKPSNATLKITGAASQISDRFAPLDEGKTFGAGFPRLYFFVTSANMNNGVLWRRELFLNGNLLMTRSDLWGNVVSGESIFFFSLPDGFGVGEYAIRLYLGETLATTFEFTVEE